MHSACQYNFFIRHSQACLLLNHRQGQLAVAGCVCEYEQTLKNNEVFLRRYLIDSAKPTELNMRPTGEFHCREIIYFVLK